jgi:hypothetical protein
VPDGPTHTWTLRCVQVGHGSEVHLAHASWSAEASSGRQWTVLSPSARTHAPQAPHAPHALGLLVPTSHLTGGVGGSWAADTEARMRPHLLPLSARDIIAFVVIVVTLFIAAGGGIGGGGVLVPLFILCLQFKTQHAVALSNLTIAGGATANLLCNLTRCCALARAQYAGAMYASTDPGAYACSYSSMWHRFRTHTPGATNPA